MEILCQIKGKEYTFFYFYHFMGQCHVEPMILFDSWTVRLSVHIQKQNPSSFFILNPTCFMLHPTSFILNFATSKLFNLLNDICR